MSKHYIQGATVRLRTEVRNENGQLTDPNTITVRTESPSGSEVSYTDAVKDSVGKYHRDILVSQVGTWVWRWEVTGVVSQADEGDFIVDRSAFF